MFIELIQNVLEGGNLKVAKRRNNKWAPPEFKDGEYVQSNEQEFIFIPFTVGTVIETSEETGKKYIEKGLARAYERLGPSL